MYAKILVPLDGSKRAEMIRPHVRELANRFEATIIFLKVIEPIHPIVAEETSIGLGDKGIDAKIKKCESYLEGVASKLRNKGITCKSLVAHGRVVEKIIEVAQAEDVDLIAMTSHGYGGLTRIFYGSVAAGILNRVDRPLFIVRSRWPD
jgi:nucleotide-binding universal stress UspA family protein